MIQIALLLWLLCAIVVVLERKIDKIIIYLGVFSLISALCFLLFGAPDVAMAEASISALSTIFFIVYFEKYFKTPRAKKNTTKEKKTGFLKKHLLTLSFTMVLVALFLYFVPELTAHLSLKESYLTLFAQEIAGENAVTSIYLGYRVYDTIFEALMLLVSVIAVTHLSSYSYNHKSSKKKSDFHGLEVANINIRLVMPIMLVIAVYLVGNGHLTPGGGFQAGVMLASFFICRYMIFGIVDINISQIINLEKIIYLMTITLVIMFIFLGLNVIIPEFKSLYLITINTLLAIKVACGFIVIFYRYVAIEKEEL